MSHVNCITGPAMSTPLQVLVQVLWTGQDNYRNVVSMFLRLHFTIVNERELCVYTWSGVCTIQCKNLSTLSSCRPFPQQTSLIPAWDPPLSCMNTPEHVILQYEHMADENVC